MVSQRTVGVYYVFVPESDANSAGANVNAFRESAEETTISNRDRPHGRVAGLLGMLVLACLSAFFLFGGILLLESGPSGLAPWLEVMWVGTVCCPLAAAFSCCAFVPMIGQGIMLRRFATASLLSVVTFVFFVLGSLFFGELHLDASDFVEVGIMMLVYTLGVGLLAVAKQLISRQALAAPESFDQGIDLMTIGSLLQLAAIAAVLMAVWRVASPGPSMTGALVMAGVFGTACGATMLGFVAGLLGSKIELKPVVLAALICCLAAGCWSGTIMHIAFQAFSSADASTWMLLLLNGVVMGSMYVLVVAINLLWLRRCGWRLLGTYQAHPNQAHSSAGAKTEPT